MKSAVILISGRGSNMQALVEAGPGLEFRAVISNRPAAAGLAWATAQGIATRALDHKAFASREEFDEALARAVDDFAPDYLFLAGFMRILTPGFVERHAGRLVNIHPSLLPSFPGLDTHERALEAGVKLHGCTVHFVTADLDHGPIIAQAAVPVLDDDTRETLRQRILAREHQLLVEVLRWIAAGRVEVVPGTDGGRVRVRVHGASAAFGVQMP